ncbi:type I glyceraldehyde-3-phosphate dehydrogenase [Candidatus Peregrinibacteria bacterium]|nr:type I glyceraldehyde-3-phosphate dehydrogenase [Candidatus Peregrinibacteria bacterium]
MKTRIAINGFGRIGRNMLRASMTNNNVEIVALNDLANPALAAHLLKYDSIYGTRQAEIKAEGNRLIIDDREIICLSERDPEKLPWKDMKIDIVIESTGIFLSKEEVSKHLKCGAKRVVISAPAKGDIDRTIVMGVNEETFNQETDFVISNASCTTNCLAPIAKVLHDNFIVKKGLMTTIHAYTGDQKLHDNPHKDLRRARAATLSMIPTTTGAAKAVGLVIPELKGKLNGMAIRVPTPTVSVVDFVCEVEKSTSAEEINTALRKAAEGRMKGILEVCDLPLVSVDFKENNHSSIVDALSTMVIENTFVKVLSWYDNEWGYSLRLVDLCEYIGKRIS